MRRLVILKNNKSKKITEASQAAVENVCGKQDASDIKNNDVASGVSNNSIDATQIKKEVIPKNVFNTRKAAELVGDVASQSGDMAAGLARAARRVVYSGGADNIGGDTSANIRATNVTKSGDRPGRQIDSALQHIDEAPAETYSVAIDTIPMLKDGSSNVGYNGNYRNEHAVSQKGAGGAPQDSDFFRTLDQCEYDQVYFAEGQFNMAIGADFNANRTLHAANWNNNAYGADFTANLGNYVPKTLTVTFNADGLVTNMVMDADDITPVAQPEAVIRAAGDAFIRERNIAEIDRLAMVDKAGDETSSNWSPLGKVIPQSSDTNRIMKELEHNIGDMVALSVAKLSHALAYQNNKAAKDGMKKTGPMFEMTRALVEGQQDKYVSHANDGVGDLFQNTQIMRNGSSELFIAIKDSTAKYNTKGKMLSLPLSFKSALSTAKQNIGSLRCHENFINELHRCETFGKIDEDGSGISPYFLSDGAKVALTLPMHNMLGVTTSNLGVTNVNNLFTIHYEDQRNRYNSPVYNYLAAGLLDWFNRHGARIVHLIHENDQPNTLVIPMTSTTSSISLWDLILCDAVRDIAIHRRYAMDLVIQYTANNGYPYSGSHQLDYDDIMSFQNIGFTGIENPLATRNIPLNIGVKLLLPEVFTPIMGADSDRGNSVADQDLIVAKTILPWYFNQNQFDSVVQGNGSIWGYNFDGMNSMTFFDYRGGVSFGNADRIKAMDPEQLKLCMDRLVTIPGMNKQNSNNEKFTTTVYKYAFHEDGIPMVNYNAYYYGAQTNDIFTIGDLLRTPRELGLSFIAPAGFVTPVETATGANYRNITSSYLGTSGPSFRIKMWRSAPNVSRVLFDEVNTFNGTFAANLVANYVTIECTPYSINTHDGFGVNLAVNRNGDSTYISHIMPYVQVAADNGNYNVDTGLYENAEVAIRTTTVGSGDQHYYEDAGMTSAIRTLWLKLQCLPFVISPFDVNTFDLSTVPHDALAADKYTLLNPTDTFDFLHLFNMCGFRCGEYSGVAFDRHKARIELGLGYVQDPYIDRRL